MQIYPAVKKIFLHLLAGLMWAGVGIMLVSLASHWLKQEILSKTILLILVGMVLSAAIYVFGFSKMALKNIHRIDAYPQERVCLFAFQKWTSYPLILFMVGLGIYLRIYSPIPKSILAILYIGLGVSLFASSIHYYLRAIHLLPGSSLNRLFGAKIESK
jgi:hypothetical protein